MRRLSLTANILLKPTDIGWCLLRRWYSVNHVPEADEQGYVRLPFREVLQVFGPYISEYQDPAFEAELLVPEETINGTA